MGAEHSFLTIVKPFERMTAAVIITLILFCAGTLTVLDHLSKTEEQARNVKNQWAGDYVTSLYQEADTVSRGVQPSAEKACTNEVRRQLRHIVAVSPHIRSVNIIRQTERGAHHLKAACRRGSFCILKPMFLFIRQSNRRMNTFIIWFTSAHPSL